jgi:diguanylate cyclase (GGDEF)-like protein/PAS domain S-box-containing protein
MRFERVLCVTSERTTRPVGDMVPRRFVRTFQSPERSDKQDPMSKLLIMSSVDLEPELGGTVLWRAGVERTQVAQPESVIQEARSLRPNVILLESAEHSSTATLIRRLRGDPQTRPTAIIVLDRSPSPTAEAVLRKAGANAVFTSPIDPFLWDPRLEQLLNVPSRREARIPIRVEVWTRLAPADLVIEGMALNMSLHGILLTTRESLHVGAKVDLRFTLPEDTAELRVVGRVVRNAGLVEETHGSGIEFMVLRDDARLRISQFVESALSPRPATTGADRAAHHRLEQNEWVSELRASELWKSAIMESALDGIITTDHDGRILELNRAAEELFGYRRVDILGRSVEETIVPPSLREGFRSVRASYLDGGHGSVLRTRVETTGMRADGSRFPMELAVTPIQLPDRRLYTAFLRDISDRKRAERQILSLAHYDVLTGLPNRLLLQDRLNVTLAQARRHGYHPAVLFLDLDRFKLFNDSLGHGFGDQILRGVAERLQSTVRKGDTLARLGGDEFVLLLTDIVDPIDAARVAEKILDSLRQPFVIEEREIHVTASVGIAVYPEDGQDIDALLNNADTAMYRAKEGRDNYSLYAPAMSARALERLTLEHRLRTAVAEEEFTLYYQPIGEVATGCICGVEALLRWHHPERGLLLPEDFLPLAEVTGLIIPIGPWVFRTACAQVKAWQRAGQPELSVAVNLSARQFQMRDLAERIRHALGETDLEPRFLALEITETNAMENIEATAHTLGELKEIGVKVSIDDFGIGYSSLNHLKRLPVDALKIDRAFIQDVNTNADDAAIVTAIIGMAHALNLEVVAEGVETQQQLEFLAARGCDKMQGYLLGRPLPSEECEQLLAESAGGQESAGRQVSECEDPGADKSPH